MCAVKVVNTLISRLKFHHYFKCVLASSGKMLPKWGFLAMFVESRSVML